VLNLHSAAQVVNRLHATVLVLIIPIVKQNIQQNKYAPNIQYSKTEAIALVNEI
jgi:hypothetical protein